MLNRFFKKAVVLTAVAGSVLLMGSMPDVNAEEADIKGAASGIESVIKDSKGLSVTDNVNIYVINNSEGEYLNRAFGGTEDTIFATSIPDKNRLMIEEKIKLAKEESQRIIDEAALKAEEEKENKRNEVVDFALQFVGNPYVYGGTSLTNGADCSGFVMSVYKNFGYSLPRTTWGMETSGVAVSESDIRPGDLVLYEGHVGIYMGEGNIVHARNSRCGITTNNMHYQTVKTIRRIIE